MLLGNPDEDIEEQAFNAVRNLTESEDGIAMVFREIGTQVLGRIAAGLSSGRCVIFMDQDIRVLGWMRIGL